MRAYVIKRVLAMVPTLLIVAVAMFLIIRLIPGSVVGLLFQDAEVPPEELARAKERLGLTAPIHKQFFVWSSHLLRGDLGASFWSGRDVKDEIISKIPVTVELALLALVIAVVLGIALGILAAVRQDTVLDYVTRSIAILGLSIPSFWLATLFLFLAATRFHYTPPIRYTSFQDDPLANLQQYAAPALILGTHYAAVLMRMTRATFLEVLRQDYIRTAWAKGLGAKVVLMRHALRASMPPVITIVGLQLSALISGSVIMEVVFGLPGLGHYTYNVISVRDLPSLQAINLLLAGFIMTINLLVDLSLSYMDPRVRYG